MKKLTLLALFAVLSLSVSAQSSIPSTGGPTNYTFEIFPFHLEAVVGITSADSCYVIDYVDYDVFEEHMYFKIKDEETYQELLKDMKKSYQEQLRMAIHLDWMLIEISFPKCGTDDYEIAYEIVKHY